MRVFLTAIRILLNAAIVILTVWPLAKDCRENPVKRVFRYFTTQSNVLCAAASFVMVIALLAGNVPRGVILFKYCGTVAVTVTLLTVIFFLAPTTGGLKPLISGGGLYLHLVNPLLAIIANVIWERPRGPFWVVLLGSLPVLLYGSLYLYNVVLMPGEKRWEDFYGFNKGGKWPVSFTCMAAAGFVIALILWIV